MYWNYGISTTFLPYSPGSATNNFYTDVLKPTFLRMRALKDMPEGAVPHYSSIHSVSCESSGLYAAERVVQVPDGVRRMGCAESKKRLSPKEINKIEEGLSDFFKLKIPRDFGGIVSWSEDEKLKEKDIPGTSEEQLLGIVYADINALGRLAPYVSEDKGFYRNSVKE